MDRKSKIFFLVMGVLILGSVAVSYYRYIVKRDYIIQAQSDCDPYTEKCFVHECDPDPDVDGDFCTGDPVEDTWYTKNISRLAYNIPNCDPSDEDCMVFVCEEGESGCSYELCDETNVPEGDTCNAPVVYTLENPVIEEDAAMEEEGIEAESDEEGITDETEGAAIDTVESGTSEEMPPQAGTSTGNAGVGNTGVNQVAQ